MEGKKGNAGAKHPENTLSGSTANPAGANTPVQYNMEFFLPVFKVIEENKYLSKQFSNLRKQVNGLSKSEVLVAVHEFFDKKIEKTFKNKEQQKSIKDTREIVEREFAKLGLCCGQYLKVIANSSNLVCFADEIGCKNIRPGNIFYKYEDDSRKISETCCQTHFVSIKDPVVINNYQIPKTDFKRFEFKSVGEVPVEECEICQKQMHEPCRCVKLYRKEAHFFCRRENDVILNMDETRMDLVPLTPMAKFIQETVATKNPTYLGVLVREVYSKKINFFSTKDAEVMREKFKKFNIELTDYSYRKRMIVVSQKINQVDTIFMMFMVTEFPELRWCTLDFLDSVPYVEPFLPDDRRRAFYNSILLACTSYAGTVGYKHMYFHASPPKIDQTYLFMFKQPRRPRTYKQTRTDLLTFYVIMLDYGVKEGMIVKYWRSVKFNFEKKTIPEIFNSIAFSSFFQYKIEDALDKYRSNGPQFDLQQFKDKVMRQINKIATNSDSFFYIELCTTLDEVTEANESEVVTWIFKNRHNWLCAQFNKAWEFTSPEQARYASLCCIKAILDNDKCTDSNEELGDWNHEDLTENRTRFQFKRLLPCSKAKASHVLLPAPDTANKVPVKDAHVVEASVAKTHAADTGAPATAIVGQPSVPQRRYRFEVNDDCVVRHLGRGWNGRVTKVGAKKKGVRGYRVAFRCLVINFVIFVPFGDDQVKLFKTRSEYDSYSKRPIVPEEQVTTSQAKHPLTTTSEADQSAESSKSSDPTGTRPSEVGHRSANKRRLFLPLEPLIRDTNNIPTANDNETGSSPTICQEDMPQDLPPTKKARKH